MLSLGEKIIDCTIKPFWSTVKKVCTINSNLKGAKVHKTLDAIQDSSSMSFSKMYHVKKPNLETFLLEMSIAYKKDPTGIQGVSILDDDVLKFRQNEAKKFAEELIRVYGDRKTNVGNNLQKMSELTMEYNKITYEAVQRDIDGGFLYEILKQNNLSNTFIGGFIKHNNNMHNDIISLTDLSNDNPFQIPINTLMESSIRKITHCHQAIEATKNVKMWLMKELNRLNSENKSNVKTKDQKAIELLINQQDKILSDRQHALIVEMGRAECLAENATEKVNKDPTNYLQTDGENIPHYIFKRQAQPESQSEPKNQAELELQLPLDPKLPAKPTLFTKETAQEFIARYNANVVTENTLTPRTVVKENEITQKFIDHIYGVIVEFETSESGEIITKTIEEVLNS